jgi:hypothetical protein
MSFSTVVVPANISVIPVDTRVIPKVLYLPTVSTNQGRFLLFKDYYGTSSNSTFTISTTGTDLIDDYNFRYTMSNSWGSLSLVSDGLRSWRMMNLYDGGLTPAGGWFPTNLPGLAVWLDASDPIGLNLSGTTITRINDKSGNNNNFTPLSGLSNGVVQSNYQNGLTVMNFSGNNIYRSASNGLYPSDVFVVVALKSLSVRSDVLGIGNTGNDNFNSLTFGEHTAGRWHNGSTNFSRTPNTVAPTNETSTGFLLMNWSIANNNFVLYRNGTQLSQTASYTYSIGSPSALQIGFRAPNGNTPDIALNVYIGEIVIYNTQQSTTNRQTVEGYLAWKWGLQGNLPANHPYKSAPP